MQSFNIFGNIVDVMSGTIYPAEIIINDGKIESIIPNNEKYDQFILPGLIDAHVHIESSMLPPSEFARLASVHGTTATVSDPHEIANVLGMDGIEFMISNGKQLPFHFNFGAPSCVPATGFESSGAVITPENIKDLLNKSEIKYLSEMMNFPGVIFGDPDVHKKIYYAIEAGKPVDGHAPGLSSQDLSKYVKAGITTDHECFSLEEAIEKINLGMKILIREGSAAKNFEALHTLIDSHPDMVMLCSDDKHPDDLAVGHINSLIKRALAEGHNLFNVIRSATLNPVKHYNLDSGLLRKGDYADLIIVDNLIDFNIIKTYASGILTAENGKTLINRIEFEPKNLFIAGKIQLDDLKIASIGDKIRIIEAFDGELITGEIIDTPKIVDGYAVSDMSRDYLKLTVINRYNSSKPAFAFIKNFGLKEGAIATSVAHDSHNIIAIGTNDEDLKNAINLLIENKGGLTAVRGEISECLPLPVAGIMTDLDGYVAAEKFKKLDNMAKAFGSKLRSPYMTLSFMALLVIPALKLSDKGLFDGRKFEFTSLFVND